ncbi:MAG TPA: hypothetical protein VFJ15_08605 [Oleiagrimonas sp.]|nr:hypothetical protein [Oleiagrimonas sp.]
MNDLPEIAARRASDDALELDLDVPAQCPWFDGHFPGRPILPGVVQVGWAAHFAGQLVGHDEPPTQIERLKFRRPLLPGAQLTLRLALSGGKVRYEYLLHGSDAPISASSGVFTYAEAA